MGDHRARSRSRSPPSGYRRGSDEHDNDRGSRRESFRERERERDRDRDRDRDNRDRGRDNRDRAPEPPRRPSDWRDSDNRGGPNMMRGGRGGPPPPQMPPQGMGMGPPGDVRRPSVIKPLEPVNREKVCA